MRGWCVLVSRSFTTQFAPAAASAGATAGALKRKKNEEENNNNFFFPLGVLLQHVRPEPCDLYMHAPSTLRSA